MPIDCMIIGDSIAVGIGSVRPECVTYAKVGINSKDYTERYLLHTKGTSAKTTIISLGSNDTAKLDTYEELVALRNMIDSDRVYWIMPNIKETKRKAVWLVAKEFNDIVIDARDAERSRDTVHPTGKGYRELAKRTKE